MPDIRCTRCNKVIAVTYGPITTLPAEAVKSIGDVHEVTKDSSRVEIKCRNCKTLNNVIV